MMSPIGTFRTLRAASTMSARLGNADIGIARWSLEFGSGSGVNNSHKSAWSRIAASKMARVIVKMSFDRQSRSASAARRNVSLAAKRSAYRFGVASRRERIAASARRSRP
jgi:hypothetical protein